MRSFPSGLQRGAIESVYNAERSSPSSPSEAAICGSLFSAPAVVARWLRENASNLWISAAARRPAPCAAVMYRAASWPRKCVGRSVMLRPTNTAQRFAGTNDTFASVEGSRTFSFVAVRVPNIKRTHSDRSMNKRELPFRRNHLQRVSLTHSEPRTHNV
jgi:hypothetical protein